MAITLNEPELFQSKVLIRVIQTYSMQGIELGCLQGLDVAQRALGQIKLVVCF